MRIDRITFKNINSFIGEHTVDFSQNPLNDAGIFAIIGPTGSGKSTLLDVITLALYNQVPRISAKSITDTVVEATGSILTRNTDNAMASIEYTTRSGSYISTWTIRKNRNGKLVSPHMDLVDKKIGKPMDLKKSQVPGENEKIIGLSYDQFVKSIILSQGEFAKFLKANKNDRGNLLEKITGTGIYREIGAAVFERFKVMEKDISVKKDKSEFIKLLDEDALNEITSQVGEAKKSVLKIDESLSNLSESKRIKELILEKNTQQKEISAHKDKLLIVEGALVQKLKKLDLHEKLNPYRANIALYEEADVNAKKATSLMQTLKKNIQVNEKKQSLVMGKMGELVDSEVTEKNFNTKMKAFEAQVLAMDHELKTLTEQGKKLAVAINEKAAEQPFESAKRISTRSKTAEFLDIINQQKLALENQLAALDLDTSLTGNTLSAKIDKSQLSLDFAKEQLQKTEMYEAALATDKLLAANIKENEKILIDIKPKLAHSQEQIRQWKENLKHIRQNKDKSKALFELNNLRKELVEGEECPLCGAVHHPRAEHQETAPSGFDIEIKKAESAIVSLEQEQKNLENQNTTATTEAKNLEKQIVDLNKQIESIQEWFTAKKVVISTSEILIKQVEELIQQVDNLKLGRSSLAEFQWLQATEKDVHTLSEVLRKYIALNKQRQKLFTGKVVTEQTDKLQDEFSGVLSLLQKDKSLLSKAEADATAACARKEKLHSSIWPHLQDLGITDFAALKQAELKDKEAGRIKAEKEDFNKRKISLETQSKSLDAELENLQAKDKTKDSLGSINQFIAEISNKKDKMLEEIGAWQNQIKSDDANKKAVGKLIKELEKLKVELDDWALLNRLIGDKTGTKFSNYAQNITLKHLLGIANRRLTNLFDRYLLDMPKDDGELLIVDTYQGNIQRGVSTLSGGESFMVSLALALSLSDMASKNVVLESLFIDEGFSTLDPEMLDLAMNTLDKIQSETQKTVGIISHVESLKDRIDVQIQLDKNARGFSTIQIVG